MSIMLHIGAPPKRYYAGSNTSGFVGASVGWDSSTRKLTGSKIIVSGGTETTGFMMVVYR